MSSRTKYLPREQNSLKNKGYCKEAHSSQQKIISVNKKLYMYFHVVSFHLTGHVGLLFLLLFFFFFFFGLESWPRLDLSAVAGGSSSPLALFYQCPWQRQWQVDVVEWWWHETNDIQGSKRKGEQKGKRFFLP